ncbi:MAG TPA: hypothetical protein VJ302_02445 [Blastocatellia bacterium]|nr:hypothetical protein [Blastocatellia bacterium]
MKYLAPLYLVMVIVLATGVDLFAQEGPASSKREVLTNDSIISLAKANFKERTILTIIRTSPTNFDISTLKLVELKKQGVSERIITEMVERTRAGEAMRRMTPLSEDDFFSKDDDAFFNGSSVFKELPSEKEAKKRQDEATIFGSQSGSRSQTRSEGDGPNRQQQGQSEVTGSATVRIIRPAGEGAAVPKLERAPKLDNQAVLELVQAGFSEGTIIRKIESSQVEFDLSAKALSDLRKNRVTEPVIKAMTQAMDESK